MGQLRSQELGLQKLFETRQAFEVWLRRAGRASEGGGLNLGLVLDVLPKPPCPDSVPFCYEFPEKGPYGLHHQRLLLSGFCLGLTNGKHREGDRGVRVEKSQGIYFPAPSLLDRSGPQLQSESPLLKLQLSLGHW